MAEFLAISAAKVLRRVRADEIPATRISSNALRLASETDIAEFLELQQVNLHGAAASSGATSETAI